MRFTKPIILLLLFKPAFAFAFAETPVINRDVHMTENLQYLKPTIPPLQTSADGRVGLAHRPEIPGGNGLRVAFRLLVPEKITTPFLNSAAGTEILSHANASAPTYAGVPSGSLAGDGGQAHAGLCDPTFAPDSNIKNPYACDATGANANGAFDCYDLTVVRASGNNGPRRLFGINMRVRVENPKTAAAEIVEVTELDTITGNAFNVNSFFEPTITGDGRMMVARVDPNSSYRWFDNNGDAHTSSSDIAYFVNDNPENPTYVDNDGNTQSAAACDVRQWGSDNIRPMAHAPYDDTINTRYGLAMQPFRDSEGTILAEDYDFGSYPWMDKDGDNITFTTYGENLTRSGFPTRCVAGTGCSNDFQEISKLNGRVIMGLWTRGKAVVLDNQLNHIDYMIKSTDAQHREIQLYEPNGGDDGYIRIGDARNRDRSQMPLSNSANSSFFDSNEHRFNYHASMTPITPADVTWLMSTGRGSDEVPFDDYLNPNSFINANMAHAVFMGYAGNGRVNRAIRQGYLQNAATGGMPHLNNSNSAVVADTEWRIPTRGRILGNGRAEPVTNGGVHGKGFWLDGNNAGLEFTIPAQTRNILTTPWYYSIFVDTRNTSGTRTLIAFPDGSEIRIRNTNQIVFFDSSGAEVHSITSAQGINANAWAHLGFQLTNGNQTISTYVDGMIIDTFTTNNSLALFTLTPGLLTLGNGDAASYTGWIDDFKVFAEQVNAEVACNHASGTLAGINGSVTNWNGTNWTAVANSFPNSTHNAISATLTSTGSTSYNRYVCYHDYTADYAAHLGNIPNGLSSIRDDINFPEGPLFSDRPRPDSSSNAFCLSCHTGTANGGLGIDALTPDPSNRNAPFDPRRQPMQPDPIVYGNIPAGWLGNANHFVADTVNGYRIDQLVLGRFGSGSSPATPPATPPVTPPTTPPVTPPATPPVTPPPTGDPIELATVSTFSAASDNWQSTRQHRVHDGNLNVEARANSNGIGAANNLVWQEFTFQTASNFVFSVREDNAPSYQISRWKVQRRNNNAWEDITPWQNANVNGVTRYTPASNISADRIRVLFESANSQRVGLREFDAIGIIN